MGGKTTFAAHATTHALLVTIMEMKEMTNSVLSAMKNLSSDSTNPSFALNSAILVTTSRVKTHVEDAMSLALIVKGLRPDAQLAALTTLIIYRSSGTTSAFMNAHKVQLWSKMFASLVSPHVLPVQELSTSASPVMEHQQPSLQMVSQVRTLDSFQTVSVTLIVLLEPFLRLIKSTVSIAKQTVV
jgi:hypothetical protein